MEKKYITTCIAVNRK